MDPQDIDEEYRGAPAGSTGTVEDMDDGSDSSTDEVDYGKIGINPLDNLFQTSAYRGSISELRCLVIVRNLPEVAVSCLCQVIHKLLYYLL